MENPKYPIIPGTITKIVVEYSCLMKSYTNKLVTLAVML